MLSTLTLHIPASYFAACLFLSLCVGLIGGSLISAEEDRPSWIWLMIGLGVVLLLRLLPPYTDPDDDNHNP